MGLPMSTETLLILWFIVYTVIVSGYIVLDGFDLGVGALHFFARGDNEKRLFLNAIGPVWDGNEVWLVVIGGSLFAGFPVVYATLLSAFYVPVMIFLAGLILRAVAIEFRSKLEQPFWRHVWDTIFGTASVVIALGLGFILGNIIQGIDLDSIGEFQGDWLSFINPYSILVAFLTLAFCMMHGNIYLIMKIEGPTHDKLKRWMRPTLIFFLIMYGAVTISTLVYHPFMSESLRQYPWIFTVAIISVLAIANIPREVHKERIGAAFLSSALAITLLVALYAIGMFPALVRGVDPETSLTIYNSGASRKTLQVLMIIVLIGIPLALAYIVSVYYIFRGKVKLDSHSY